MIVTTDDLQGLKGRVVMVDGVFDPLHFGHVKYFQEAAKLGLPVLCNVQSDKYIEKNKSRVKFLPENQRVSLIDNLRPISYVHLCKTSTADVLKKLLPKSYVKGLDWKERGLPQEEVAICNDNGINIIYLDTKIESSTSVVENFISNLCYKYDIAMVRKFEQMIFQQNEINSEYYDKNYFNSEWRQGGNSYSIEVRRKIEGKNPFNIKNVFNPKRVLDVGCGPGALMYFLHELGIEVYGIDFSESAKRLAPKEIRDNIVTYPVTEYYDFDFDFDLVICRETLEHLTVLQIRKAVATLAAYTSKFLYVTTRFYQNPKSLLDVGDDRETDPTHITVLNKEFLKLLFILEGLKYREDLEKALDWKGYGRVLVFERVGGR